MKQIKATGLVFNIAIIKRSDEDYAVNPFMDYRISILKRYESCANCACSWPCCVIFFGALAFNEPTRDLVFTMSQGLWIIASCLYQFALGLLNHEPSRLYARSVVGILALILAWWVISIAIRYILARRGIVTFDIVDTEGFKVSFTRSHRNAWPDDLASDLRQRGTLIAFQDNRKIVTLSPPYNAPNSYGVNENEREAFLTQLKSLAPYTAQKEKERNEIEADNAKRSKADAAARVKAQKEQDFKILKHKMRQSPNYPFTEMEVGRARVASKSHVNYSGNIPTTIHSTEIGLIDLKTSTKNIATYDLHQDEMVGTQTGHFIAFLYGYSFEAHNAASIDKIGISIIGLYDAVTGKEFFAYTRWKSNTPEYGKYGEFIKVAFPRFKEQADQEYNRWKNSNHKMKKV